LFVCFFQAEIGGRKERNARHEIQDKPMFQNFLSCRNVADKTLDQVWNLLGNEVTAPGCSAAAMHSHGREARKSIQPTQG